MDSEKKLKEGKREKEKIEEAANSKLMALGEVEAEIATLRQYVISKNIKWFPKGAKANYISIQRGVDY